MSRGAAQAAMRSATGRDPVKATLSTSGCVARASPRVGPSPVRQPTTPGGRPARSARSQSAQAASGASWAGLTTTVQPAARAGASFQTTRATGKFHGVMAATTPIGSGRTQLPVVGVRPGSWVVHRRAASAAKWWTTSAARSTSARASASGLPSSACTSAAIRSRSRSSRAA